MRFNFLVTFHNPEYKFLKRTAVMAVRPYVDQETGKVDPNYLLLKTANPAARDLFLKITDLPVVEMLPLSYRSSAKMKVDRGTLLQALGTGFAQFNQLMTVDLTHLCIPFENESIDWEAYGVTKPAKPVLQTLPSTDEDDEDDEDEESE